MRENRLSNQTTAARSYHHGHLRDAAVKAAIRFIERDSGASFTLREIGKELGVTHVALYRHFPDRDGLLAAVAEDAFSRLLQAHETALDEVGASPVRRLKAVCRNQVDFALANAAVYRLMFGPDVLPHRHPGSALHVASQAVLDLAIAAVDDCQRSGDLAGSDPMLGGLAFWSAMHGIACLAMDERLSPKLTKQRSLEVLVTVSIEGLIAGLASPEVWDCPGLSGTSAPNTVGLGCE